MSTYIALLLHTLMIKFITGSYLWTEGKYQSEELDLVCRLCRSENSLASKLTSHKIINSRTDLLKCSCSFKHEFHKECLLKHFITDSTCPNCKGDCSKMKGKILSKIASNTVKCILKGKKILSDVSDFNYEALPSIFMFKTSIRQHINNYQDIKCFWKKASINRLDLMKTLKQAIFEIADYFLYTMPCNSVYNALTTEPYFTCSKSFILDINNPAFYRILSKKQISTFITMLIKYLIYESDRDDTDYKLLMLKLCFLNNFWVFRTCEESNNVAKALILKNYSLVAYITFLCKYYEIPLMNEDEYGLFISLIEAKSDPISSTIGLFLLECYGEDFCVTKKEFSNILTDSYHLTHEESTIVCKLILSDFNKYNKCKRIMDTVNDMISAFGESDVIPEGKHMVGLYYDIKTCECYENFIFEVYEKLSKTQNIKLFRLLLTFFNDLKCDFYYTWSFYINRYENFQSSRHRLDFLLICTPNQIPYQLLLQTIINDYWDYKPKRTEMEYLVMIKILFLRHIGDMDNKEIANYVLLALLDLKDHAYIQAMQRYFIDLPSYQDYIEENINKLIEYSKYVPKEYVMMYLIALSECKGIESENAFYGSIAAWIETCFDMIEHHASLTYMLRMVFQRVDFKYYITKSQIQEILIVFNRKDKKGVFIQILRQEVKSVKVWVWTYCVAFFPRI